MSRSYKKVPSVSDQGRGAVFAKRHANKRVRHNPDVQNGGMYRKLFCSYDICDWRSCYWSKANLYWKYRVNINVNCKGMTDAELDREWIRARMK